MDNRIQQAIDADDLDRLWSLIQFEVRYLTQPCQRMDRRGRVYIHTPLFHSIGSNQGSGFSAFEHLLRKCPDLTIRAYIQTDTAHDGKVMDCIHKNQDHFFTQILALTPLGYAEQYEHTPNYRKAAREAQCLRDLGAVV